MIWGQTTHVGCGWTQFPLQSNKISFNRLYPDGEYENFFVCNYGVGKLNDIRLLQILKYSIKHGKLLTIYIALPNTL